MVSGDDVVSWFDSGVEDGIDLDFLYPDSESVAINFSQLRNPGSTAGGASGGGASGGSVTPGSATGGGSSAGTAAVSATGTSTSSTPSSRNVLINRRPSEGSPSISLADGYVIESYVAIAK